MRKKFQALQKDIEEQREQLTLQHEQQKELYNTIKGEESSRFHRLASALCRHVIGGAGLFVVATQCHAFGIVLFRMAESCAVAHARNCVRVRLTHGFFPHAWSQASRRTLLG